MTTKTSPSRLPLRNEAKSAITINRIKPRANAKALLSVVALALFSVATLQASDPIGIYAIVEKVTVLPNDTALETAQVFGTFSFAKPGGRGEEYTSPQRGYLFYRASTADKDKAICQKEWADLQSVAGQQLCVGFGSRHKDNGKLRALDQKPSEPDPYPIANGITKVKRSAYPPVKRLYDAAASPPSKAAPQVDSDTKSK